LAQLIQEAQGGAINVFEKGLTTYVVGGTRGGAVSGEAKRPSASS